MSHEGSSLYQPDINGLFTLCGSDVYTLIGHLLGINEPIRLKLDTRTVYRV